MDSTQDAAYARTASAHGEIGGVRWPSLVLTVALVSAFAALLISPRFSLDAPSLVDDWSAISRADDQMGSIVRLSNPEESRFRPGWVAWNYVQWHTLDAPQSLTGPNVWNLLRIIVLVAGLCLLTSLALARGSGIAGPVRALLIALPAVVVVSTPGFAVDLARFGPQEPALVGGMALGGSLLVVAGLALLANRPVHIVQTAILATVGGSLWVLGAYHKEASLAVLPLLVAVAIAGRRSLRGFSRLSAGRRTVLALLTGIAVLPLVHVAIETVRIASRGNLVYEAELDGGRGAAAGLVDLVVGAHGELHTPFAQLGWLAAVAITAVAALATKKVDWVGLGALASGALALGFAGQAGVVVSRYYLPTVALFGIALALGIARLHRTVQVACLACVGLVALLSASFARADVVNWTELEKRRASFVDAVADLDSTGCTVAVSGLEIEFARALPVLVALERRPPGSCTRMETYFVIGASKGAAALTRACDRDQLERLGARPIAGLYRCKRLASGLLRDPRLGLIAPDDLVSRQRLRPHL